MTNPAPPTALEPKWTMCQFVGFPFLSFDEYWHMGDTNTRFLMVSQRISIGVKSLLKFFFSPLLGPIFNTAKNLVYSYLSKFHFTVVHEVTNLPLSC